MRGQPLGLGCGRGANAATAAKVVSGPGLASIEVTPDWITNEDDWRIGLMMSAMTLMSSQSAGNSQAQQQSVVGATVLTRAVSEPLSVLTASYAVDYQSPRSFVIGSPLHAYLAIKTPQFVNTNQRVYNLKQVCYHN